MNKHKLLDAYGALEAQIVASNKVIGQANELLDDKFRDISLTVDDALVLKKVAFNLSVWGNQLNLYFVCGDFAKRYRGVEFEDSETRRYARLYAKGKLDVETLCDMVPASTGLCQHVQVSVDNALVGMLLESERVSVGVEEDTVVLQADGLQATICPVDALTDVC